MSESIIANELRQLVTGPMARNPEHAVICNLLWAAAGEIDRLRAQLASEAHGHRTMTAEVERLLSVARDILAELDLEANP